MKLIKNTQINQVDQKIINENFLELDATKLPYTGATSDVDLGAHGITTDFVQFNTSYTPRTNTEGLLQWNSTDGTLDLGMSGGDITLQVGQEMFVKVSNKSGALIPNGSAVYFDGRLGNRPIIQLAKGDTAATARVVGLTTQDIDDDSEGFVTTTGYVRGIKTDYAGWSEGDLLWVSDTTAGSLTNVQPSAPNRSDIVGSVGIVHSNLGSILININPHTDLKDLSDINGTPLTVTGQMLTWDNVNNYFDFTENIYSYVPYVGATTNLNLGANKLIVEEIESVGDLTIDCGTEKTVVLTEPVWDDLREPITSKNLYTVPGTIDYDFSEGWAVMERSGSLANPGDVVLVTYQLPHGTVMDTLDVHIHWVQTSNSARTFAGKYRRHSNGGTPGTTWTSFTADMTDNVFSTSTYPIVQITRLVSIPIDTLTLSSLVQVKLTRDDALLTADVYLLYMDAHYKLDQAGSRTQTLK